MFIKGKTKIYSDSSVRDDTLYNILVDENVETCRLGGVKKKKNTFC